MFGHKQRATTQLTSHICTAARCMQCTVKSESLCISTEAAGGERHDSAWTPPTGRKELISQVGSCCWVSAGCAPCACSAWYFHLCIYRFLYKMEGSLSVLILSEETFQRQTPSVQHSAWRTMLYSVASMSFLIVVLNSTTESKNFMIDVKMLTCLAALDVWSFF